MEAHPVGSRWAMKARERGAKLIHVDPHFSRTSAAADMHVPIRAGSDIAFLGGLIRHIIETKSYFEDYVVNYTNAPHVVREDFQDTEDLDGLFSGFDPETGTYDRTTWLFEGDGAARQVVGQGDAVHAGLHRPHGGRDDAQQVPHDPTLQHPRCVLQVLRRHYSRYTPEMVERICGIPEEQFLEVAETLIANSGRERTTMLAYAVGWTQHTAGVQMIRAGSIVQLLLGNIGRPGGGIMAMRGHALDPGLRATSRRSTRSCRATCRCRAPPRATTRSPTTSRPSGRKKRLVVALRRVHRLPAQGLVRRGGDGGERLRLRAPAEADRQPLALRDDAARARRRPRRHVRDGPEPGGRLIHTRAAAARAGEA